jgi:hypothetical protein
MDPAERLSSTPSFKLGLIAPKETGSVVELHARHPASLALVEVGTAIPATSTRTVLRVLAVGHNSQVEAAIIEPIPVDVIDLNRARRVQKPKELPVHVDSARTPFGPRLPNSVPLVVKAPDMDKHALILVIKEHHTTRLKHPLDHATFLGCQGCNAGATISGACSRSAHSGHLQQF